MTPRKRHSSRLRMESRVKRATKQVAGVTTKRVQGELIVMGNRAKRRKDAIRKRNYV